MKINIRAETKGQMVMLPAIDKIYIDGVHQCGSACNSLQGRKQTPKIHSNLQRMKRLNQRLGDICKVFDSFMTEMCVRGKLNCHIMT